MQKFNFGDVVIVEDICTGLICKIKSDGTYGVYVCNFDRIEQYTADNIHQFPYNNIINHKIKVD
jgi:hypothetical protein